MGRLGGGEILLILFILMFLFGGRKLPELASGLGKAMKNFRRAVSEREEAEPSSNS